ncbi:conjugal transfer protein [Bacillus atrophaeus]|uniref:conjugal transfer protein n=1 Tax=Bacillus atrophaeus TaxID=1452 RepID=UPI002DBED211|nr:conjugal transfer protein [Bacillus atrophaeus]MEC1900716.1 conjugal transfer protein [Bacillus atrophaeus]MEC2396551.1 conjugal transfer protein [Bacillus atrophaeus]MED4436206.1 conjugal transfer protein [Bacillus atrophaeus]MED4563812.1 conjugal transfer protein [Bacillus atrophaeus]MED4575147.1 conjugal transfer protein [Bacillus atrophaeus]
MLNKETDSEKKEESFWRSAIQKLKRVKRPEKASKKVPRDRSKMVAVTLWSSLSALLLFSLLSVLLSVNTRSAVNDIKNNSNKPSDEAEQKISVTAAENFLAGFIAEYVNVKNDDDSIDKRKKNLESYMVKHTESDFDDEERFELDGLKGDRQLNEYSLYNVKEGDKESLFQFKVSYTNLFPVEKEVEKTVKDGKKKKKVKEKVTENEKAEKQMLLNIPVTNKGDSFAVSAVPYFTEIYDLKGDIASKSKETTRDEYTGEKKDAIETFLHTFFEKYASEKKEEMVYMMKKPEALQGSLLFSEIKSVKIFETKKGFEVICAVQFKEKENEIPVNEKFTLEITENSGQYYVNQLNHQ